MVLTRQWKAITRVWLFVTLLLALGMLSAVNAAPGEGETLAPIAQSAAAATSQPEVHVQTRLLADTTAVVPGKPFKLGVELTMDPGWHTYYKESGDAGMPTRIVWDLPKGFTASDLLWEKPNKFNDAGIVTYGYHDKTLIGATITPPATLKPGSKLNFKARIKWLSCKDVCLPGQGDAALALVAATSAQPANSEAFARLGFNGPVLQISGDSGASATVPAVATAVKKTALSGSILNADIKVADNANPRLSLVAYIAFAFIGGFILNFMPCVLPVISIKVLSFMQQAGDDPKRVFKLGLTFTAGIISSFLVLAASVIAVKAAGQQIGWGFQFQYPVFLLGMAAIVLLFALSLFGLFYIQLQGQDQIDKLASKEGYTGTFFKGVLATTLSTPCSAPFLGTALGFAFSQPAWVVLLMFFAISAGMAFPYVLLTANPGWMKYMPKPGVWMEKFKESMGFLLLATVVWLVWVLGQQVGLNAAMAAVGFLVALSFAVWLVGRFTDLTSSNARRLGVYSTAAVIIAISYITFLMPFPQLLTMNPAQQTGAATVAEASLIPASNVAANGITWVPFSIDQLNADLGAGRTVFLDFTADWCLTCKVNENTVLNTPEVTDKLKALNAVTMRADWTRQDAQISQLLHKFGRSGVPLYVIFPSGHPTEPIVLPEVITRDLVLQKLDEAAKGGS